MSKLSDFPPHVRFKQPKHWGAKKVGEFGYLGRVCETALKAGATWEDVAAVIDAVGKGVWSELHFRQAAGEVFAARPVVEKERKRLAVQAVARAAAATKRRKKGATMRDRVCERYRLEIKHRTRRVDIPGRIATATGLAPGTVRNYLRALHKAGRI